MPGKTKIEWTDYYVHAIVSSWLKRYMVLSRLLLKDLGYRSQIMRNIFIVEKNDVMSVKNGNFVTNLALISLVGMDSLRGVNRVRARKPKKNMCQNLSKFSKAVHLFRPGTVTKNKPAGGSISLSSLESSRDRMIFPVRIADMFMKRVAVDMNTTTI